MRAGVGEVEGQRGLRVGAAHAVDAGSRTAERAAAIGADDETRRDGVAVFRRDHDVAVTALDRDGVTLDPLQRLNRYRAAIERRDQMAVRDVLPERIEPDL